MPKEEVIQPVHISSNDIWMSNMGTHKENGKQIENNPEKHGKTDAWHKQDGPHNM